MKTLNFKASQKLGLVYDRAVVYTEIENAYRKARQDMDNFTFSTPIIEVDYQEFYKVLRYFRRKVNELDYAMHKEVINHKGKIPLQFGEHYAEQIRTLMTVIAEKLQNRLVRDELYHHFVNYTSRKINWYFRSAQITIDSRLNELYNAKPF